MYKIFIIVMLCTMQIQGQLNIVQGQGRNYLSPLINRQIPLSYQKNDNFNRSRIANRGLVSKKEILQNSNVMLNNEEQGIYALSFDKLIKYLNTFKNPDLGRIYFSTLYPDSLFPFENDFINKNLIKKSKSLTDNFILKFNQEYILQDSILSKYPYTSIDSNELVKYFFKDSKVGWEGFYKDHEYGSIIYLSKIAFDKKCQKSALLVHWYQNYACRVYLCYLEKSYNKWKIKKFDLLALC